MILRPGIQLTDIESDRVISNGDLRQKRAYMTVERGPPQIEVLGGSGHAHQAGMGTLLI